MRQFNKQMRKLLRQGAEMIGITAVATRNIPFGFDWLLDIQRLSELWGARADTFFDVGANDGIVSLRILERFPKAEVQAFEPHPVVFNKLRAVGQNKLRCHELALSDSEGFATLYVPDYDKMSSLLPKAPSLRQGDAHVITYEVRATTIDAFCAAHGIKQVDVLKVDAEGHDLAVIRGANRMLAARGIKFVYVEFSTILRQGNDQSGALYPIAELLFPYGLRFIASYTEQVGTTHRFSLVSNALFALPPRVSSVDWRRAHSTSLSSSTN